MSRLIRARVLLFAALGSVLVFLVPATAQATPHPDGGIRPYYTGQTYADTPSGLAACKAEGTQDLTSGHGTVEAFYCNLNNPDSGLYGLWLWLESL